MVQTARRVRRADAIRNELAATLATPAKHAEKVAVAVGATVLLEVALIREHDTTLRAGKVFGMPYFAQGEDGGLVLPHDLLAGLAREEVLAGLQLVHVGEEFGEATGEARVQARQLWHATGGVAELALVIRGRAHRTHGQLGVGGGRGGHGGNGGAERRKCGCGRAINASGRSGRLRPR